MYSKTTVFLAPAAQLQSFSLPFIFYDESSYLLRVYRYKNVPVGGSNATKGTLLEYLCACVHVCVTHCPAAPRAVEEGC